MHWKRVHSAFTRIFPEKKDQQRILNAIQEGEIENLAFEMRRIIRNIGIVDSLFYRNAAEMQLKTEK